MQWGEMGPSDREAGELWERLQGEATWRFTSINVCGSFFPMGSV